MIIAWQYAEINERLRPFGAMDRGRTMKAEQCRRLQRSVMRNSICRLLETAAEKWPERIALADEQEKLDYSDYREKARRIGSAIRRLCGDAGRGAVAVLVDRSIRIPLCFLGVAYSGNYYVPVDGAMPEQRRRLIFTKAEPLLVIDARRKAEKKEGVVLLEELVGDEGDGWREALEQQIDTDPLCVIFTSGSTGVPKGVLKTHRSVLDMCSVFSETFGFTEENIFGNQAPFDFDVSTKDIYNSLYAGARLEILSPKLFRFPGMLPSYLTERGVDTLEWAVSALRILAECRCFDGKEVPPVRNILFSGEQMPVKVLAYWRGTFPDCRFVNLYGPTEISGNCSFHVVERDYGNGEALPIGRPFSNTRLFLLNESLEYIRNADETGELCFTGGCMALGYLNDPERTAEAFIPDPESRTGISRIYRTGDLGYRRPDGEFVFVGRKDTQIKHMGHRIELGEVETAVNGVNGVEISCCLYDQENCRIVCFYQAKEECGKEIALTLAKALPKYMWPAEYVYYKKLPLNRTSKIDRVLLKQKLKEGNYGTADQDHE